VLAWAGYSVFPASFAVGYGFITALVVFHQWSARHPGDRPPVVDTLVGGFIGLLAYALWPTWAHTSRGVPGRSGRRRARYVTACWRQR
jgi:hypothetical protein